MYVVCSMLTKKQKNLLLFINKKLRSSGISPSYEEMKASLNLKTLETEINTTYDIHNVLINHKGPLISESGLKTKDELLEINKKTNIKTFLIGESLLKNLDKNSIFSIL